MNKPRYTQKHIQERLLINIKEAQKKLHRCCLCPRNCGVNRMKGEIGICQTGRLANVASFNAHFGEERPLVGNGGSGTIFFSGCNLGCSFCQNYDISHWTFGDTVTPAALAEIMLSLQSQGCHNINFVTPTHVVPQILEALPLAIEEGLNIPLIYNSSGYDSVETLKLLESIFDIFMPDFKFWDGQIAKETCDAENYPQVARTAIKEMYRQVGDLEIHREIAGKGLLIRHLVLPDNLAGTRKITEFISKNISKNTYINIMGQYRPCGTASNNPRLSRSITTKEFMFAFKAARIAGLSRFDQKYSFLDEL